MNTKNFLLKNYVIRDYRVFDYIFSDLDNINFLLLLPIKLRDIIDYFNLELKLENDNLKVIINISPIKNEVIVKSIKKEINKLFSNTKNVIYEIKIIETLKPNIVLYDWGFLKINENIFKYWLFVHTNIGNFLFPVDNLIEKENIELTLKDDNNLPIFREDSDNVLIVSSFIQKQLRLLGYDI